MMNTTTLEYGPFEEENYLSTGVDFYKPTMSQVQFEKHPEADVTFTFKNRGTERLADFVAITELTDRLEAYRHGWNPDELAYLASLTHQNGETMFSADFLDYLADNELPPVQVELDPVTDDLAITTTGDWPLVTFWETVVMSEVNELYFANKVRSEGLDLFDLYDEGDRRLSEKIALLQSRPDIKFSDFGTRRRFSYRWQNHVTERLMRECPDNFMGTSNVYLAHKYGVKPIGTFAHEMPMVYAGLARIDGRNPLEGHREMLEDWYNIQGVDLSTALTDTFGSDFFFADFTKEQAEDWRALRHDSGDPIEFGEKAIAFYEDNAINPLEKTIVFSDGLDIATIVKLADYFKDRINVVFGWGTTLMNDLGLKPLNIVMKATNVNGESTVKLSDDTGKHTGTEATVLSYEQAVQDRLQHSKLLGSLAVA